MRYPRVDAILAERTTPTADDTFFRDSLAKNRRPPGSAGVAVAV